ncbi:hypothetical protein QTN47_24490 [Danxiaibacter flavus]|uniref:DUF5703 domain-containing protein n=1 Tax=Danxiaibacter flavus TaxID=3049108 RepID=A0ABV3ZLL0_9BACT|nr:hypothetical protein QNM32_24495 [Chitinophagaceae bacterium DXS]
MQNNLLTKIARYAACCSIFVTSFIVSSFSPASDITLTTDWLTLQINNSGNITGIVSKINSRNYGAASMQSPLLTLYKDSVYIKPTKAVYNGGKKQITLNFSNGSVATVGVVGKGAYLRFELQKLMPRNGVQAIVWGPFATSIHESIGETVCVVHDNDFAVGLQALNINTIEGLPDGNDNAGGGSFIDPLPGQHLPDSLKDKVGMPVEVNVNVTGDMPEYVRMYRGSAAVKKSYGSELRLFSRDRRIPRIVNNGNAGKHQYVQPVDVDFAGSAIAFFGCEETKVLDVIGEIEKNEKLPHPMLNGEWVKRSPVPGQAYLMYEGKDMTQGMAYADSCGFKLIHAGDLFESWGHFGLHTKRFPQGAADIEKLTNTGWHRNIALGVHTLTMFTGTNDAYISPVPSDSLAKSGTTSLSKDLSEDDKDIFIDDPSFFRNAFGTHTVKIGKELINFRAVSTEAPWRLLDCKRGQYKTAKTGHKAGERVDKLVNSDYQGFYPDIYLQDAFAKRLATVCNTTGLGLMDFDGYGGESPTGHGTYGAARFVDLWYRSLDKYVLTCGAGTFHYYWHIYSFMNWGEPWYNALRQSQVNYRIENQRYFNRNYMPHMLGWFSLGADYRPEEIEWIQARSAAFNAGYLLRVDESIEKNGFKTDVFSAIREWQSARNAKAFSKDQLKLLQDPKNEFHLEKTGDKSWNLYPVNLQSSYEHKFRRVQTGEPVSTRLSVQNPYAAQPAKLYITIQAEEGNKTETVSAIKIEINSYQSLEIDEALKAGDRIVVDGKSVYKCDATWNKIKELKVAGIPQLNAGVNQVVVTSEFSSEQSPRLKMEFKFVGEPQKVKTGEYAGMKAPKGVK